MQKPGQMMLKNRTAVYFLCQIVGWGTYVAIGLFFLVTSDHAVLLRWKPYVATFGCSGVVAVLTTHFYRSYVHRRGWLRLSVGKALLRVTLSSLVLGVLITGEVSLVWFLFGIGSFRHLNWLTPALLGWTWIVFIWNLLYFGVHYFEQYRQAQVEKLQLSVVVKEAQLQGLVSQINPHFMFNCLNSLRALITEDPARAQNMVTELSELLRYSLQSGKTLTRPLQTELKITNTYLKLEAMRFDERLVVHIDVAPAALAVPIPSMLLQSLVENGVKHGIEKLPEGGQIRISSRLNKGSLQIQVVNSGQLGNGGDSTGIGLANIRNRLRLLYGKSAMLTLRNQGPDFVSAEVSIPLEDERS